MTLSASRGALTMATRQLQVRWNELRESWRDQKAAEFEETYLAELTNTVTAAVHALEDLEKVLQKIHADCQ